MVASLLFENQEARKEMTDSLKGKIAAVTGVASGIERATTRALVDTGAKVVMVDCDRKALGTYAAEFGDRVVTQITDLLDAASCAAMVPEILAKIDHVDILHCNARSHIGGDLIDTDTATTDRMLSLNVNAVTKNVRAIVPHMIERTAGDILVTCSVAGNAPTREPVYSSSKKGDHKFRPDHAPAIERP